MEFSKGDLIWVNLNYDSPQFPAIIQAIKIDSYIVTVDEQGKKSVIEVKKSEVKPAEKKFIKEMSDQIDQEISERNLIQNLETSQDLQQIRTTFPKKKLIAASTQQNLQIFDQDTTSQYLKYQNFAYLFMLALEIRKKTLTNNKSVVLIDQNGYQKQISSKYLIQQLCQSNFCEGLQWITQESVNIIKTFCDLKTEKNQDVSISNEFFRFQFENQELNQVKIDTFLFDLQRVIQQETKDRNSHIFYQICLDVSDQVKKKISELQSFQSFELRNHQNPEFNLQYSMNPNLTPSSNNLDIFKLFQWIKQFKLQNLTGIPHTSFKIKIGHSQFIDQFKLLCSNFIKDERSNQQQCKKILRSFFLHGKIKENQVYVNQNSVFLKEKTHEKLLDQLQIIKKVVLIQNIYRSYKIKNKINKRIQVIQYLKARYKIYQLRHPNQQGILKKNQEELKLQQNKIQAVETIQKLWRKFIVKQDLQQNQLVQSFIQSAIEYDYRFSNSIQISINQLVRDSQHSQEISRQNKKIQNLFQITIIQLKEQLNNLSRQNQHLRKQTQKFSDLYYKTVSNLESEKEGQKKKMQSSNLISQTIQRLYNQSVYQLDNLKVENQKLKTELSQKENLESILLQKIKTSQTREIQLLEKIEKEQQTHSIQNQALKIQLMKQQAKIQKLKSLLTERKSQLSNKEHQFSLLNDSFSDSQCSIKKLIEQQQYLKDLLKQSQQQLQFINSNYQQNIRKLQQQDSHSDSISKLNSLQMTLNSQRQQNQTRILELDFLRSQNSQLNGKIFHLEEQTQNLLKIQKQKEFQAHNLQNLILDVHIESDKKIQRLENDLSRMKKESVSIVKYKEALEQIEEQKQEIQDLSDQLDQSKQLYSILVSLVQCKTNEITYYKYWRENPRDSSYALEIENIKRNEDELLDKLDQHMSKLQPNSDDDDD